MRIQAGNLGRSFVVLALALAPVAQDKPVTPAKPDPLIEEKVDLVKAARRDKKMARDAAAVRLIDELSKAIEAGVHPSDRKRILREFTAVLTKGKLRPPDRAYLYEAVTKAFGKLGKDGAKVLHATFKKKRFPKKPEWLHIRALLVEQIGATQDPKMIDFLTERASRDSDDLILVAAGKALANYAGTDQKTRKTITKTLVAKLAGVEGTASQPQLNRPGEPQDFSAQNARETLRAINGPFNATLEKLTGEKFARGTDWQRWFNKNKSKNWDKLRRTGG